MFLDSQILRRMQCENDIMLLHRLFLLFHVHKAKVHGRLGMVTHPPTCLNTAFLVNASLHKEQTSVSQLVTALGIWREPAASERMQALHAGRVGKPERSLMRNQVSLRIMTVAANWVCHTPKVTSKSNAHAGLRNPGWLISELPSK